MALVGALAVVSVPLTVQTTAWADTQPATTTTSTTQLSDGDWDKINEVARTDAALGVTDTGSVVRLASGTSAGEQAKADAALPADTSVQVSQFSTEEVGQIQKTATDRDWNADADKYSLATGYDPASDKVVVYTDAPESVTGSLTAKYPGDVEVKQARLESQRSRFDDAQPFWGGDALVGTQSGMSLMCTNGFAVTDRNTGHDYMTTAGHCYGNLTHVYSRRANGTFGNWVGQVQRRDQSIDTELIGGNTDRPYDSYLYTGGTATSGSAMFVHGTQYPDMGTRVCVSGSVSLNHCGHKIVNNAFSICYSGGINCIKNGKGFLYDRGGTNPPAYDNGELTQGGDSGGPIYTADKTESAAWIVGGHSGLIYETDDPCHCSVPRMVGVNVYAIVSQMGVDVMTR